MPLHGRVWCISLIESLLRTWGVPLTRTGRHSVRSDVGDGACGCRLQAENGGYGAVILAYTHLLGGAVTFYGVDQRILGHLDSIYHM